MTSDPSAHAVLMQMIRGYQLSLAISVGARLGVPDLLKDGSRSGNELAQRTETHPPYLYRLLRALAAAGLLTESPHCYFALTPLGALLRTDVPDSLHATASFLSTERSWERWGNLLHKVRTGESVTANVFVEMQKQDPEQAALFNAFMTEMATRRAAAVLGGYHFSGIRTLVDVGGGHGRLLASILGAYPSMRGVLFDLPHVIEGAKGLLEAGGVADRCERVAGSFFETVPKGGDAYLLSVVIHDWEDARAVTILRNCLKAMGTPGRLLLIERVVASGGEQALEVQLADLNMMIGPGGRERTAEEFDSLLSAAGFRLERIVPLESSYNVVEGVPVGG